MQRGILSRLRAASLVLALAALVLKALLPPGFMLDMGGERVAITLCNGGAATLDLGGHDAPTKDTSQHCPFAVAATSALDAPTAIELPTPAFASLIVVPSPRALALALDATGPPLPARGPPLQA
jgi:hypothetical protein